MRLRENKQNGPKHRQQTRLRSPRRPTRPHTSPSSFSSQVVKEWFDKIHPVDRDFEGKLEVLSSVGHVGNREERASPVMTHVAHDMSLTPSTRHKDLPSAFTMSQLPNRNLPELPVSYLSPSLVQPSPLSQNLSAFEPPDLLQMHQVIMNCLMASSLTISAIRGEISKELCKHVAFSLQMEKHLKCWSQLLTPPQQTTFYLRSRTLRNSNNASSRSQTLRRAWARSCLPLPRQPW